MTQFDAEESQYRLRQDIKRTVKGGGNVSHILTVEVSYRTNTETEAQIKDYIFRRMAGVPITQIIEGVNVAITWRTSAVSGTSHYHADVKMFTDMVVKQHTQLLLRELLVELSIKFNLSFMNGDARLHLLLTRPLTKQIVLP